MTQTNATWYVIRSVAIIKSLNWSLQKCFGNYVVDIHHCATFCPDFFVHQCMTSCTVYTYTYLTALFLGLPGSASNKKVKPIWILLKQETEWQWHQLGHMQVCNLLQTDNHASTPPLSFFTSRMPFLSPNQQHKSTEGTTSCTVYSSVNGSIDKKDEKPKDLGKTKPASQMTCHCKNHGTDKSQSRSKAQIRLS